MLFRSGARFKRPVMPGDQLHLHATMDGPVRRGMWKFSAEAKVDGIVVTAASLMCTVRRIDGGEITPGQTATNSAVALGAATATAPAGSTGTSGS